MNNLSTNTLGIDATLKSFQEDLYGSLIRFLDNVDGYGRVYKNDSAEGGATPEWWNESKKSYEEMYLDNKKEVVFYFIVGENHETEDGSYFTAPLKVVFIFDLLKLDTPNRADAEAQKIAVSSIQKDVDVAFDINGIEIGIENVFLGFDISKIKFDDMQPFHIFSVNGTVGYYLTQNC